MTATYIPRPKIDAAIFGYLSSGAGLYALEGPGGAGKSAALWHGLGNERERRGKHGHGHVRILQLWGDEPPSLFARRLVREVGLLNLVAYPQPERLVKLCADMAQSIPGLSGAGKVLGALVPDDLRPLPQIAAQALAEAGMRAIQANGGGEGSGPLCIGIDLLGGDVSSPVREFFTRLCELLPQTVVLLFAQPGGHNTLAQVPAAQRLHIGPFSEAEAAAFLAERIGPLDGESRALLSSGRLSLLPGDLLQIVNLYTYLGQGRGLHELLPLLERDIVARYQTMFDAALAQPGANPDVLELCALCAVTARPQQPLTLSAALERMRDNPLRPAELAILRQAPLVRALITSTGTVDGTRAETEAGWPIEPANAQARDGVLQALSRHGLREVYEQRWLDELLTTLRRGFSLSGGLDGLHAGVQALSLLTERATRQPSALGQAVELLAELETPLWRAGWHRTFAELFDALAPRLLHIGVSPRDIAPKLWFRRARARIQSVDWSEALLGETATRDIAPATENELPIADRELYALFDLSEDAVTQARLRVGLLTDGKQVTDWCRHLPYKARQARGYAHILQALIAGTSIAAETHDDLLIALAHFMAANEGEDIAQTLTILGDAYSARGETDSRSDALALYQYEQAVIVAERVDPLPEFCLGMIHRSIGNHHRRRGRFAEAASAYGRARRHLLRSPDARIGTLLANLLPL